MRRKKRLTESGLHRIVKECVRKILSETRHRKSTTIKEAIGWNLEKSDVTFVNDSESGASDKIWMVRIWTGSGYFLPAFAAYASGEEDALDKVVAYLDKEGDDSFFFDEDVEQMRQELEDEGMDEEDIDNEINNQFMYVDATMDGAGAPHYIILENLRVYPYDEKRFKY